MQVDEKRGIGAEIVMQPRPFRADVYLTKIELIALEVKRDQEEWAGGYGLQSAETEIASSCTPTKRVLAIGCEAEG